MRSAKSALGFWKCCLERMHLVQITPENGAVCKKSTPPSRPGCVKILPGPARCFLRDGALPNARPRREEVYFSSRSWGYQTQADYRACAPSHPLVGFGILFADVSSHVQDS